MSSTDGSVSPLDAKITAAQVLTGLAMLLRSDDPQMHDRDQRLKKAAQFDRVASALLAEEEPAGDYLRHSSEWTGNLSFLLGIHDRRTAG
ncbi:hypothetical protein [Amycolatopsis sp. NPDC004079]|uniref:hypothetical protein n=1 Tax=Amycolatopsis sp. NPDC004079 TaxID=3154549 RepID=UPI0033A6FDC4